MKHTIIKLMLLAAVMVCYQMILPAQSPSKRKYIEAAEKEFADKNYYGALLYYNEVLEFDKDDKDILYKSAEAARKFNSYSRAAEKYSYLIDSLNDDTHPDAVFWLASMKQHTGEYEAADRYYDLYLSEYGGLDTLMASRARKEKASVAYAKTLTAKPKKNVKLEKLGNDVNTPSSEVAGSIIRDELYFASMRYREEKPQQLPAREISKILKQSKDSMVVPVPGVANLRDNLVSNAALSADGSLIYYTVCDYINGSDIRCQIFRAKLGPDGTLSDEVKLPDPVNIPNTTSTHPHISTDPQTGREMMFFVSDRKGGAGGLDIWYSLLDAKFGFSEPVNLREVNTLDNEITPFYNKGTGFLFFSSDGREGMGGYDVYKSSKTGNGFGSVVHGGTPLNSSYNDIYYYETSDGSQAYFSSNRKGSLYLDDYFESCCYDIYKMDIIKLELDLNALTYDKVTGRPLKNATVILIDQDTGAEIGRFRNDDGNEHKFPLTEDKNYLIIAQRENYYPDTLTLSTIGAEKSESIVKKMYLSTDMMLLDVFTFTKIGKLPLEGTTITITDLTDPSKKEIIEVNNLSNDFHFMVDRGKQYKITARKEGYTDAVEMLDTRPYDKSGLITVNMYLDKFVLQDLLPISLYFDNDLPDIASKSTLTSTKYGDLVTSYMSRKEDYKDRFSRPLAGGEADMVRNEYENFFEGDVRGGYDKFRLFIGNLLQELEAGNKVELVLKGFTSPRAESKYNLALGQRRVNSVKNEMVIFDNEQLRKYFLSGQLKITDISFGKELSPPDVPSDIKDERNSIYNLKAAKQRRVEILRASRNNASN